MIVTVSDSWKTALQILIIARVTQAMLKKVLVPAQYKAHDARTALPAVPE
jgi:hypothetical protein